MGIVALLAGCLLHMPVTRAADPPRLEGHFVSKGGHTVDLTVNPPSPNPTTLSSSGGTLEIGARVSRCLVILDKHERTARSSART